jgi:hypothetical protein
MIGAGDLLVKRLDLTGAQWRPIGNATVFSLQPQVEKFERKSFQRDTAGQTIETINRINGVEVKITVDTFGRQNLALALAGEDAALTQTAAADLSETLTLPHGEWAALGKYKVANLTLSSGGATYAEEKDYLLKPEAGMVLALATGVIPDAGVVTASYDCGAILAADGGYVVDGGKRADILLGLRLDGRNEATGNSELTEVWRVRVAPQAAVSFITSEFNKLELQGRAETPEDKSSPFRTTVIPV